MKNRAIIILIVKTIAMLFILVNSSFVFSYEKKIAEFVWPTKQLDTKELVKYKFSELAPELLRKVAANFKETPYFATRNGVADSNAFEKIIIESVFKNDKTEVLYLIYSIEFVLDVFVVYEVYENSILEKYSVSAWTTSLAYVSIDITEYPH